MFILKVHFKKTYDKIKQHFNKFIKDQIFYKVITVKRYKLVKWGILCLPKEQGGLENLNLELQKATLLANDYTNLLILNYEKPTLLANDYTNL